MKNHVIWTLFTHISNDRKINSFSKIEQMQPFDQWLNEVQTAWFSSVYVLRYEDHNEQLWNNNREIGASDASSERLSQMAVKLHFLICVRVCLYVYSVKLHFNIILHNLIDWRIIWLWQYVILDRTHDETVFYNTAWL